MQVKTHLGRPGDPHLFSTHCVLYLLGATFVSPVGNRGLDRQQDLLAHECRAGEPLTYRPGSR